MVLRYRWFKDQHLAKINAMGQKRHFHSKTSIFNSRIVQKQAHVRPISDGEFFPLNRCCKARFDNFVTCFNR